MQAMYEQHATATRVGGLAVLLIVAVMNADLVAWCIRIVQRGQTGHLSKRPRVSTSR